MQHRCRLGHWLLSRRVQGCPGASRDPQVRQHKAFHLTAPTSLQHCLLSLTTLSLTPVDPKTAPSPAPALIETTRSPAAAHLQHPGHDALGALPLPVGAQRSHERGAGDHVRAHAALQHLVEQRHRALPAAARRAGADRRSIRMACRRARIRRVRYAQSGRCLLRYGGYAGYAG